MDSRKSEKVLKKSKFKVDSPRKQEQSKSKRSTMKEKKKSLASKTRSKRLNTHKGLNGESKPRVVRRSITKKQKSARSKHLNSLPGEKLEKISPPQTERTDKNRISEFYTFMDPVAYSTAFIQKLRLGKEMNFIRNSSSSCSNLSSSRNHTPYSNDFQEYNTNRQTPSESAEKGSSSISKIHTKKAKLISKTKRKKLCPSIVILST